MEDFGRLDEIDAKMAEASTLISGGSVRLTGDDIRWLCCELREAWKRLDSLEQDAMEARTRES